MIYLIEIDDLPGKLKEMRANIIAQRGTLPYGTAYNIYEKDTFKILSQIEAAITQREEE